MTSCMKVCGDFSKGSCTRDRCIYAHNTNPNASAGSQVCGDFKRGSCTRATCKYIHNTNENASLPRVGGGPEFQPAAPMMNYMLPQFFPPQPQGTMPLGCKFPSCKYAHNINPAAGRNSERCNDFPGPCKADCKKIHNVNTNSADDAPVCGDFSRVFQEWNDRSGIAASDSMPFLPPQSQYANVPGMPMPMFFPTQGMPQLSQPAVPSGSKRKSSDTSSWTICGDFLNDKCTRDHCSYVHNSNPQASRESQICADFSNGSCTRESCKYIHNVNTHAIGLPISKRRAAAA